jgi:general secretion pathway protein J
MRKTRPRSRRPGTGPTGFTLIEVLVALALMAALVAIVGGGLRLGARTWGAAQAAVARTEDIATTYALMRRLIERAYPLAWGTPDEKSYAFEGGPKVLRFVALLPAYPGLPGPYFVGFRAEKEGKTEILRLSLVPFSTDEDATRQAPPIEDIVLVDGPLEVAFSYWGDHDETGTPRWGDRWDNRETLPTRIRIDLGSGETGAGWPTLTMAVGIELDVACLFSDETPISKCRLDSLR